MKKRDLDFSTICMNCFDLIHLMCGFFLLFREIKTCQTNPHGPEMLEFELPNFTVMVDLSGFQRGSFPTRYLGLPLDPRKINMATLQPFLKRITSKLHSWTVKCFSFAFCL